MHRFFSVGLLSAILLVSCQEQEPPGLPPEEVLSNAAHASQNLESALFTMVGSFSGDVKGVNTGMRGSVRVEGVLQNGGEQVQLKVNLDASARQPDASSNFTGLFDVIVAGPKEVYLQLHSLEVDQENGIFRPDLIEMFRGKWWQLPSEMQQGPSTPVTPDPRLLRAQSEVVKVVKDYGIETRGDRRVYHYSVVIDPEKLLAFLTKVAEERGEDLDAEAVRVFLQGLDAKGELWIDAETFYVHSLSWTITPITLEDGRTVSGSFTVDLRDHNAAPPISPPAEATLFSPLMFLGLPSPEAIPTGDGALELQSKEQEQLFKLLQDSTSPLLFDQ